MKVLGGRVELFEDLHDGCYRIHVFSMHSLIFKRNMASTILRLPLFMCQARVIV